MDYLYIKEEGAAYASSRYYDQSSLQGERSR
jgi:hypothetical protein